MSDFAQRPAANLGNFADQLHIDASLGAGMPAPKIDAAAAVRNMPQKAPGLTDPAIAAKLFGHYADPPSSPGLTERLDPLINRDGVAVPHTGGNVRIKPLTDYNMPDAPEKQIIPDVPLP